MTDQELATEGAKAIINAGVEGGFGSISCSTAGNYPSMSVSQWEGSRGDQLLSMINGGNKFSGRTYSDIQNNGELDELSALLDSSQGQAAALALLSQDCLESYVPILKQVENLDDSRCFIYALCWCPTSQYVVKAFLRNRQDNNDIRNIETVRQLFRDQYYIAASVGSEYADGYANRANITFDYITSLDLSKYGIPAYA